MFDCVQILIVKSCLLKEILEDELTLLPSNIDFSQTMPSKVISDFVCPNLNHVATSSG